jgi:hypothetical protein
VVDEAAVKKFSVRDVIGRVSGGVGAMRRPISVLSNLNTWRTSHCGLPPGDRVADRNGCKRATRVVVGAGQPLRRAQGLHLGLQGVRRRFPRSCIMAKRRSSAAHGSSCRALCFLSLARMIGELRIQRPLLYWARARQPSTSIAATISPITIRKSSLPSPSLSLQR